MLTLIFVLSCLLTLAPFVSSADTLAKAKRLTHFYSVASLLEKRFACHHSTPYFFIIIFPTAFYDRSRMTGRYLIPLKNRTHLCLDSYRSRWSGMASHSLLQRRLAPRKVVRLLPDKRGQFTACILYSFMTRQTVRTDFYFFSLFSGNRKPQGFLFPWGLLILLYAFAISAVSAFLLTLTLSMTGFPFLSLEMTSIRKRSNSGSNS